MRAVGTRCATNTIAALLMAVTMSGCAYHEWVHTAAGQADYPQLIDHVRSDAELQGQLDKRTNRMFREGEYVPSWDAMGVDIVALLANHPGGTEGNFLHAGSPGSISFQYYHPHDDLFGPNYRTFHIDGEEELFSGGVTIAHNLIQAAPGVWVNMATEYAKSGNAFCGQRTAVRLHVRRALADLSTLEAGNLAGLVAGTQRMGRNPRNCGVYMAAGDSQWRTMRFTTSGSRLPVADRAERPARVVSLAEVRRVLAEE